MDTPHSPALLKPAEAAELLGVSRSKVYALASEGELPSYRIGRSVRFSAEDIEQFKQRSRRVVMPTKDKPALSLLRAAGWKG